MRFSDVTLEGLMKEFEQISKASEGSEQTYTLPRDLLDQPAAVADVPFYDEILKSTASERSKLYGVVGDSKILDEAHPKGSAKLEGLSGEEVTVEDLQDMKKKFEDVVHSTVKAKKAALAKKLEKLAKQLGDGGHTQFASEIKTQISKLAEEMTFGDEDALVTDVPKSQDITVEMGEPTVTSVPKTDMKGLAKVHEIIDMFEQPLMDILGPPHYTGTVRTWNGLDKDLRKYFKLYPSNVKNPPFGAKTYSNWQQLAQLVREGLDEWKYLSDNLQMGEGSTHDKAKGDQPASIDMQKLREGLVPGPGAVPTGQKGPPVAPQIPLSMPGRIPPR
jgi:hypothetical protein